MEKNMIIDARTVFETPHGRPFTTSAAVANALDQIGIRHTITVDELIDPLGVAMGKMRLDMLVNRHKGDRRFTVRQCKDGALATITRLG
jgi:hypothetical protein